VRKFAGSCEPGDGRWVQSRPAPEICGALHVLYRGYIANRAHLAAEAHARGAALPDCADGRLFALAYSWWGADLQAHVTGEYAVAVLDTGQRTLVLTHDALGVVPVFYAERGAAIEFASHLDALLEMADVGALDEQYLAEFLTSVKPRGERTPYRAVRRLLAGRTLVHRRGRVELLDTWNLARVPPAARASDREYDERFRELLREGVAAALPAAGPVWSELSGGLDSSSVTCAAAESGPRPVHALSLVYSRSRTGDEQPWMRTVVAKYSLPWHVLDVDATPPFSEIPTEFYAEPNPVMLTPGLYRRYNELMDAHGAAVLLTGRGGDLVLGGDSPQPFYLADLFYRGRWGRLLGGLREVQGAGTDERALPFLFFKNVMQPLGRYAARLELADGADPGLPPYLRPETVRRARLRRWERRRVPTRCRSVGGQYVWNRLWSVCLGAGTAGDQRAESFEFRSPLLYRPLVEFMFALPAEQMARPGQDRVLQRRALAGLLPEVVRLRRGKRGGEQAYFEGLRNSRAWTEMLTDRPRLVARGLVDAASWADAVAQARFGRTHRMPLFLNACAMEVWLRQIEGRSPSRAAAAEDRGDGSVRAGPIAHGGV